MWAKLGERREFRGGRGREVEMFEGSASGIGGAG